MNNISLESLNASLSQKIENLIDSGLSGQEALAESLMSISDDLTNLGLSEEFISSIKTTSSSIFEQSLTDGLTVHEAINIVLKNIKESLENHNSSENIDNSTDYNLNFVDPLNSEGAKLIDEGISQGLSVEDAIKNANLKLFPDQNIQGPQAFSELKDIKNNEKINEMINTKEPVIFDCRVDPNENCYPMIPSGKPHNQMLLGPEDEKEEVTDEGKTLV